MVPAGAVRPTPPATGKGVAMRVIDITGMGAD
jgi:hypothetical protein